MIRLEKASKYYGSKGNLIRAVDEVSLEIKEGEFVMLTGPSGSGKTTLLNLIGGMTRPDSGEIFGAGKNLPAMSDAERSKFRARMVGFVFQFQSMFPALNALDNVRLPFLFAGREDDRESAQALLARMGLADRIDAFSHQLSAGQQRRVCIARALINRPALLLCDEPTGDLDIETEAIIMKMITEANQSGATVLMATHNPGLCSYAARWLRIKDGRISDDNFPAMG